ncbi:MAG: hypothetical protein AAFR67_10740, partial [Chloroflexota bacterium]
LDRKSEKDRNFAISVSLDATVALLNNEDEGIDYTPRFYELAIFPEDTAIPFDTVEQLWNATADYDDLDTEDALTAMSRLSLFTRYDTRMKMLRLHDVVRQVLGERLENAQGIHAHLVAQWAQIGLTALPDDYAWRNIAYHLQEADQRATLRGLLLNFDFLQNKLNATDPNDLIADCDTLPDDRIIYLMQSAISLCAHIVQHDPQQLASSLSKHLSYYFDKYPEFVALVEKTHKRHLIPTHPTFSESKPAGGALLRTLEGHTSSVWSVALAGEIALSASDDNTLKLWNWQSGALIRTLEGHTKSVNHVALAGDFAISASDDNTLKLWNWQSGTLIRTLEGHTDAVSSVALAGDFAISASGSFSDNDNTLKVWNWQTGELIRTLEGHTKSVNHVALAGEIAISASHDNTLKLWNWQSGELIRTLEGHTSAVQSVVLAGEIAISASYDYTLKVWNWQSGALLRTLEGLTNWVQSVALAGDFAISASSDYTLKVWN